MDNEGTPTPSIGPGDETAPLSPEQIQAAESASESQGPMKEFAGYEIQDEWLATGSWDRTVKIWEAATGKELLTLTGHTSYVYTVAFSPDGKPRPARRS